MIGGRVGVAGVVAMGVVVLPEIFKYQKPKSVENLESIQELNFSLDLLKELAFYLKENSMF